MPSSTFHNHADDMVVRGDESRQYSEISNSPAPVQWVYDAHHANRQRTGIILSCANIRPSSYIVLVAHHAVLCSPLLTSRLVRCGSLWGTFARTMLRGLHPIPHLGHLNSLLQCRKTTHGKVLATPPAHAQRAPAATEMLTVIVRVAYRALDWRLLVSTLQ